MREEMVFLEDKKRRFEEWLTESFETLGEMTPLRRATEYALSTGGKRFRPLLVLLVAEALNAPDEPVEAALSVEYFHTASLIADDLPCMDNDQMRRGKECAHRVFGESVALLSSYALITAAFEMIQRAGERLRSFSDRADFITTMALKEAAQLAGIRGATSGQFFDLFPQKGGIEELRKIFYLKTVTLFEVSFLFGWLFGGGDLERVNQVKALAHHFGMAFQIVDDMRDFEQDRERASLNFTLQFGMEKALEQFNEEMERGEALLSELGLKTPSLTSLFTLLRSRVPEITRL